MLSKLFRPRTQVAAPKAPAVPDGTVVWAVGDRESEPIRLALPSRAALAAQYVAPGVVEPAAGTAFLDRSDVRPGMLVEGSAAVAAFDRIGWGWGGRWTSVKDHQHVSATGR